MSVKKRIFLIVMTVSIMSGYFFSTLKSGGAVIQEPILSSSRLRMKSLQQQRQFRIVTDIPKHTVSIWCKGEFGVILIPAEARHPEKFNEKSMDAFIDSTRCTLPKSMHQQYTVIVKVVESNVWEDIYSERIGD